MEMVENLYKHSKVYGNNMKMVGNLLKLYGNYMETIWKLYGKDVERMWKQYGNEMEMEFSFCYLRRFRLISPGCWRMTSLVVVVMRGEGRWWHQQTVRGRRQCGQDARPSSS